MGRSYPGLRSPLQLTKAPSVLLNRKVGLVGVPGQGLSPLQWDSVLNLLSAAFPNLLSPSPGDVASLHSACLQLNPRPEVGGTVCTPLSPTIF